MRNGVNHPKRHVVYKAKKPIKALVETQRKELVIPAGSVLVWEHGDLAGEIANVSWLRQRVHVRQADLFVHCERVTGDDAPI